MWYIFPQLTALGQSTTAQRYGINDIMHAKAFAAHPVLGHRLRECTQLVLDITPRKSANDIFGFPDDLKFCSCMTLFREATKEPLFQVKERSCWELCVVLFQPSDISEGST
jgi:uncharacterized protein (DUF1810 family)